MKGAPQVSVVARSRDADVASRILDGLARQTYRETRLVLVRRDEDDGPIPSEDLMEICSESRFAAYVEQSRAERVLFWPEEGDLKEAAIEKLVLALEVAPDQDGVADAARGTTGLWMARRSEAMTSLMALWIGPPARWIEACAQRKPALFYLAENLTAASDPSKLRRPYGVGHLFGRLPLRFKNYQPISVDPLWPMPPGGIDDRSVLFLVSSLPMGGACKFILDVAGQLKSRGHRVTVATTAYDDEAHNPNPWLEALLRIVADVFVLSHARPVELPRLIVHLARTRRCGRVVISHSMLGYQLLPWLRSELPEVAFLDYTHIEYETEWPNGGYAQRSVGNQSLLDMSMVSSEHLRQWMVDRGAAAEKLRVCHTNIDITKWTPDAEARTRDREELGIAHETALILYPCRLTEQKRPELMCNIVAALRRSTKVPFVVVVAGDGPLMPALRKFVEKEGLEGTVRVLGAVSLERVARLHNASDIFLLPSLIEGIALALFEAMALESVPVVAEVGGQRELVPPDCGYLIPLGETEQELASYVAVLKYLLENPEPRRQMGCASRARVRDHFRLSQMTTTFLATLQQAGLRHRNGPARLPEAAVCRESATLAIDHVRLTQEALVLANLGDLLRERLAKQEKIIAKLHRRAEAARSPNFGQEENAILG